MHKNHLLGILCIGLFAITLRRHGPLITIMDWGAEYLCVAKLKLHDAHFSASYLQTNCQHRFVYRTPEYHESTILINPHVALW